MEIIMWLWGFGLALAVAVAGGYALWLGVRKLVGWRRSPSTTPSEAPPGAGSLLRRGETAVARLREQCSSPKDPLLRDQISDFDDQAAAVLADLRRSAEQVSSVEHSLQAIPVERLRRELAESTAKRAGAADPSLQSELLHVERSLTEQLAVAQRLESARATLLARIEAAVLDLEGLSARVAELIVMHDMVGESETAGRLAELAGDVDGMRAGLAEARQLSSGILDPAAGSPSVPVPAVVPPITYQPAAAPAHADPVPSPAGPTSPPPDAAPAKSGRKSRPGRPRWDIVGGVVALVLVATCLVNAFVPHRSAPFTFGGGCVETIGFLGVLSGDNDGDGQTEYDAVKLAVEQDNAAHPSCTIQVEKFDTDASDKGASAAASLIAANDEVLGVVGPTYGSDAEDALPILDPLGVPVISASASTTSLANGRWKVFHRTLPSDDDQVDAGLRYLTVKLGVHKTFVVADDSTFGEDAGPRVISRLKSTVVGNATTKTDTKDFSGVVSRITASKADSVYFAGYGSDGGRFVKALRAAGSTAPVMGGDQLITTSFFTGAGDSAEGAMATCPCVPTSAGTAAFESQFHQRYGTNANYYAPEAYDAANVLLAGIRAGHKTRASLLSWVNSYDADGVSRHIQFTPTGNVTATDLNIWVYAAKDGRFSAIEVAPNG